MSDVTVAIRSLRKTPGFAAVAMLTLGIGIGASVALFSVFDRLVLNPVSVPNPSSLVAIWTHNPQLNLSGAAISWGRFQTIRDRAKSFSSLGLSAFDSFTLTGNGDPEQLAGRRVSAGFFATLGVMPAIGRNFTADEDVPNGPAVCVISYELWQTRFGGQASLLNSVITLNGQPWQVIGIMPPHLSAPFGQALVFAPRVFEISALTATQIDAGASYAQAIARLQPGVSLAQAASELSALDASYREQFASRLDVSHLAEPRMYVAALVGSLEPTFYTLIGAVTFVLLIACANVASLFLGRLSTRQKEIALRQSLGATRGVIVRQFLTESLVFSIVAGLLGTFIAVWGLTAIQSLLGAQLPANTVLALNGRALMFTFGLTLISAVIVGLVPAVHASRQQLVNALKDSARGSTGQGARLRGALMVGEVALSMVLLVGSSLLLISFLKLQQAAPGFEPNGAATAFVNINPTRYSTTVRQTAFFEQVIDELRRDPAVTEAAAAIGLPFSGLIPSSAYVVEGSPVLSMAQRPLAGLSIVSEDYFKVMRIGLVEGRAFAAGDREGATGVCIINASLARRLFPGQSALGRVMLRGPNATIRNQIVGVIHDVKTNGLTAPTPDEIYFPMLQFGRAGMNVVARTRGDAAALEPVLRRAVAAVDRNQPTAAFTTLDQSIAVSLGAQRIVASLTTVFAALALVLSAVGLYSVLAYLVSQRRAEVGIRMALGARKSQVIGLFMRTGLRLVIAGLVIGLGAAAGVSRLIGTLLFDVQPLNAAVYAAVAASFMVIAALACLVPSWRAARIDPLRALRAE